MYQSLNDVSAPLIPVRVGLVKAWCQPQVCFRSRAYVFQGEIHSIFLRFDHLAAQCFFELMVWRRWSLGRFGEVRIRGRHITSENTTVCRSNKERKAFNDVRRTTPHRNASDRAGMVDQ